MKKGSLPSRGAWIEICRFFSVAGALLSLPSRGAWIEIQSTNSSSPTFGSRSPHGERGLKSLAPECVVKDFVSLPSRGAWIEIME